MSSRKQNVDKYSSGIQISTLKRMLNYISLYVLWLVRRKPLRQLLFKHFFTPKSYKLAETEIQYLNKGERFEIPVNDQKVIYWKWGTGPVILFSHGWNGRGIQFYHFFDKLIKNGFSIVAFDGPGHGESECKTCSYFQMTDTVRALISHLNPKNMVGLVGHSFGASAIINAASKENLKIPAVLIAPAIKLKEMLEKTIRIHGVPNIIYKSLIGEYEKKYGYHFHNDNPYNLLKTFNINALILHDSDDQTTPFSISQETAKLYKSIDLIKTDGLGHIRILRDDGVINEAISYLRDSNLNGVHNIRNRNKSFLLNKKVFLLDND